MTLRCSALNYQNCHRTQQFWVITSSSASTHNIKLNRADVWKQTTDQQIDAIRKLADYQGREAQGTFRDIRARSKATAFEMWERSEPLRQGAQDVGEGLVRAWAELRASFGKAANRLSSSEADMSPRSIDEQVPELPRDPSGMK